MDTLLTIRDLVVRIGEQTILDRINLDVKKGEIKVVMGPSGAGKSTLLRALIRLVEPTSGSMLFKGDEVLSSKTDIRLIRQKMSFVFQQFALYRHLSVLDNVTLALCKVKKMSRADAEKKAYEELARLDMTNHAAKFPVQLSGGQKQRVALARALATDPDVILLDEPTSALDPILTQDVADLIKKLNAQGVTMLCVTHDLPLARALGKHVTFMERGLVRAEGLIADMASNHADAHIRQFFKRDE